MDANAMIEVLAENGSDLVKAKCKAILSGKTTIEKEKQHCGGFLKYVFEGDFKNAYDHADYHNKHILFVANGISQLANRTKNIKR